MDRPFWDQLAPRFGEEVFDVVGKDRRGAVRRRIRELAARHLDAIDFGCGVGRHLPMLARRFGRVWGTDISGDCLQIARAACRRLANVRLLEADLAADDLPLPRAHFGLSINVLIMAEADIRGRILANIARHLRRGGHALLVVPSLESVLFAHQRLIEWNRRDGSGPREAWAENRPVLGEPDGALAAGLLNLDGSRTKHFLREELRTLADGLPLRVLSVEKVTYPWTTEFHDPPPWMKAPYPWDWMILLRRR